MTEPESDDRRADERYLACFAAHIDAGKGREHTAVIRDLSVSGAKLLTRRNLPVGGAVTLRLYLTSEPSEARAVTAKVVRTERRAPEVAEVWQYDLAVQFDQPLADLDAEIQDLARRQAARESGG